jgi:hypothetical protein
MNKPFSGQYLASHGASNGDQGFLILNVDPDKAGKGIVYQSSRLPNNSAIYECEVFVDSNGVISGKAFKSRTLEEFHHIQSSANAELLNFRLEPRESLDLLRISGHDGSESVQTLQPIRDASFDAAVKLDSWDQFKEWSLDLKKKDPNSIFRGVSRSHYDLRTSFHRTGRVDLERYRDSDFPAFTDVAETIGGLRFDSTSLDVGSSWGFAQHHGFPTPLLDWTESPFVAAYFALNDWVGHQKFDVDSESVRVYSLDGSFVNQNMPSVISMSDPFPRIWAFKPKSKGNQRMIFQQGIFLHSNIVCIEAYLGHLSSRMNRSILSAVDLPVRIAREAIRELGFMGVNHMALFPGLDGAARFATLKQFYSLV